MERFGVFKKRRDAELLFVGWAETFEDAKRQIQELVKANGNFNYAIHDFRRNTEVLVLVADSRLMMHHLG